MIVGVLVLLVGVASSQRVQSTYGAPLREAPETRGFSRTANLTDFLVLREGKLQRIELVLPVGAELQQQKAVEKTKPFVLTPDGRLEKLQEPTPQKEETQQYYELTADGRLQRITKEQIPTEESGEYHVILPNGSLQRVRFMSVVRDNKVSARVMYQEVAPLQGPLYRYASPLVRVV